MTVESLAQFSDRDTRAVEPQGFRDLNCCHPGRPANDAVPVQSVMYGPLSCAEGFGYLARPPALLV